MPRSYMPRSTMDFGFPRFTGAVRAIVIASTAVYLVTLLAQSFAPGLANLIYGLGTLSSEGIRRGWIWQFVTYAFLEGDPLQFLFSMLGVYFLGSAVEQQIGTRRFVQLYFFSSIAAGVFGFVLSLTGLIGQGPALTAGAAVNAILMVFWLLNRNAPIMLLPLPIPIPVKWIVIFTAAVEGAYLLLTHFALFYLVMLAGLPAGYVWFTALSRRRMTGVLEDGWHGMRDRYYRWKRRRAARKFEVYMRKHNNDPKTQYFDEYGNYRGPGSSPSSRSDEGDRDSRSPWVH